MEDSITVVFLILAIIIYCDIFFDFIKFYRIKTSHEKLSFEVIKWYFDFMKVKNPKSAKIIINENSSEYCGTFIAPNKITIYTKTHSDTSNLIDTIIHEVVHFHQYIADRKNFNQKHIELMELEARGKANILKKHCIKYLQEIGYIKEVGLIQMIIGL